MGKCKFKVGDIVRGIANGRYSITDEDMTKGEVVGIRTDGLIVVKVLKHKFGMAIGSELTVDPKYFEKVADETIVIYRKDEKTVVALDKSTGKKAYARCHPVDTFDFHEGAERAFNRLTGKEEKPDKPKVVKCERYNVGDKVLIRGWDDMEKEFGLGVSGSIKCEHSFVRNMKKFCNTVVEISRVTDSVKYKIKDDDYDWTFTNDMIAGKVVGEPENDKPEFVPHLESKGYSYGNIGEETLFKDAIGRSLRVGDTVELYDSINNYKGECIIVKDGNDAFVMGVRCSCKNDGTITNDWKIILKRKFEDIPDGGIVDCITYVKKERA